MALIIEDGTIVANANCYGTVADFRTYCTLRGITAPTADDDIEVLLIKAMDYIEAQHSRFQGIITDTDQTLQWPRQGVYINGLSVNSNTIPRELEYGLYALAAEANAGNDLLPTRLPSTKGVVSKEKIGSIEVVYESSKTAGFTPGFAKADALLSHLYARNGLSLIRS